VHEVVRWTPGRFAEAMLHISTVPPETKGIPCCCSSGDTTRCKTCSSSLRACLCHFSPPRTTAAAICSNLWRPAKTRMQGKEQASVDCDGCATVQLHIHQNLPQNCPGIFASNGSVCFLKYQRQTISNF